jgi:hypothetical protein
VTLHELQVPPRDVAAGALGLVVQAPAPAALAELVLDGPGGRLVLGILGSSHVVTASTPAATWTEQVSCDARAQGGTGLPEQLAVQGYRITSSTRDTSRAALGRLAAWLRRRSTEDDTWICGTFPTDAAALTALTASALDGGGWTWRTWHLYPGQPGVVVRTASKWTP